MARRCKCKICKKNLTTDIAYKIVNSSGKNEYYCNKVEYDYSKKEKWFRHEFEIKLDEIVGYEIINNYKRTLYNGLNTYTNEEIYNCLLDEEQSIKKALATILYGKNEGDILRYIFGILRRSIRDASLRLRREKEREKNNNSEDFSLGEYYNESFVETNNVKKKGLMGIIKGNL